MKQNVIDDFNLISGQQKAAILMMKRLKNFQSSWLAWVK